MKYFQGLGYGIFQPIFQMEYVLVTATNNCTLYQHVSADVPVSVNNIF